MSKQESKKIFHKNIYKLESNIHFYAGRIIVIMLELVR